MAERDRPVPPRAGRRGAGDRPRSRGRGRLRVRSRAGVGQDRARAVARPGARAASWSPKRAAPPIRSRCGCAITTTGFTRRSAPVDPDARAVFDALETARVEALGARAMGGVRDNLARADRGAGARRRDRPRPQRRGSAAGDRGRPDRARAADRRGAARRPRAPGSKLVAPWIEEKAGAELDALALTLDDQAAFAKLVAPAARGSRPRRGRGPDRGAAGRGRRRRRGRRGRRRRRRRARATKARRPAATSRCAARRSTRKAERTSQRRRRWSSARTSSPPATSSARALFASPGRRNWDLSPETDYKAFTTRFDEIVEADELCDEEELGRLRAYLDQQMGGLAERRHPARQPAAAAADGAAGAQLGLRPGGRPARRRAAGPRGRQSRRIR